jgi:hypothetical protein
MRAEQVAPEIDGCAAALPGPEEQRQQFGVGQRRCAARQQFFARPFFGWPVTDAHGRSLPPAPARQQPAAARIPVSYRRVNLSVEFLHG